MQNDESLYLLKYALFDSAAVYKWEHMDAQKAGLEKSFLQMTKWYWENRKRKLVTLIFYVIKHRMADKNS